MPTVAMATDETSATPNEARSSQAGVLSCVRACAVRVCVECVCLERVWVARVRAVRAWELCARGATARLRPGVSRLGLPAGRAELVADAAAARSRDGQGR
eukprot:1897499-Pleurochrysis_carterae.AAC.1